MFRFNLSTWLFSIVNLLIELLVYKVSPYELVYLQLSLMNNRLLSVNECWRRMISLCIACMICRWHCDLCVPCIHNTISIYFFKSLTTMRSQVLYIIRINAIILLGGNALYNNMRKGVNSTKKKKPSYNAKYRYWIHNSVDRLIANTYNWLDIFRELLTVLKCRTNFVFR